MPSTPDFLAMRQCIERGEIDSALAAARSCLPHMQGKARGDALLIIATGSNARGNYVESVRAAVAATEAFEAANDRAGVCEAMVWVANALRATGDYAAAVQTLEQAEAIARAAGNDAVLASVLQSIGVCCSLLGRHQQALSCLQEALALHMAHGAVHDQMLARLALCNAQGRFGRTLAQDTAQYAALLPRKRLTKHCLAATLPRPKYAAE